MFELARSKGQGLGCMISKKTMLAGHVSYTGEMRNEKEY
jgi:hypothetical protein